MKAGVRARASGRFVLRIDPGLHGALRKAASESGLSLNDYCARKLAAPLGNLGVLDAGAECVSRAAHLFGESLIGIAAFGSWARGDTFEGSDIDLLIVVEPDVRLTRALYRLWDRVPLAWEGRTVETHFVHLPTSRERATGLWAEVAVDGIVLFERGLRISSWLSRIRRDIVSGRIVRKTAHGQPYWTGVA